MERVKGAKTSPRRQTRASQEIEAATTLSGDTHSSPDAQQIMPASTPREAEQASELREQEARFEALALATGQITWTARGDGSEQWGDGRAWRLFTGQDISESEDSSHWSWLTALHPDDRERASAAWSAAIASKGMYEVEYRVRRYDGEYRQLLVRAAPALNADGSVREWAGVATDITERVRAEQMLIEQNDALALIISGRPLEDILAAITDAIAQRLPSARATLALASSTRATPSAPDAGARIGSAADVIIDTLGSAVYSSAPLTSPDIAHDLRWPASWRDLCLARGILACHIEPVLGTTGQTLAALILYFDTAREPDAMERQLARFSAHTASVAIERSRADQALRESQQRLDIEFSNAQLLQRLSGQMALNDDLNTLYQQIVDVAVALMSADMGSMQMYFPDQNVLRLLAWKGFDPASAAFWDVVRANSACSCGVALDTKRREIIPDIEACAYMAGTEDLDSSRLSGIRAVQSTPLIARDGRLLGMISTHWIAPRQLAEHELRLLDVLARQAADLIERTRAQADLRESESRLRLALDSSSSGTFIWYVNEDRGEPDEQMRRLFGVPEGGELNLAVALATMIHVDDRERYAAAIARAVDPAGPGALKEDIRVIMPDESERWLAITGQVYFEGLPRRPLRMAGTATDITVRKRAEEALRASEARQAFLLTISDALRPLTDPVAIQRTATRVLGESFGVSRAVYLSVADDLQTFTIEGEYHLPGMPSMVGQFALDSFGPSLVAQVRAGHTVTISNIRDQAVLTAPERDAYAAISVMAFAGVPLVKNERLVSILSLHSATPREWTSDEIALIQDVAERTWAAVERARAEEALRASELALQQANQRKDEFLGIASHELRTPLTSAKANVEIVARRLARTLAAADDDAEPTLARLRPLQPVLARSASALDRLNRLVADLLDVTRIQAGKLEMRVERMDLVAAVRNALDEETQNWPGRETRLKVETPSGGALWVQADPDRIHQVVTNYLSNAFKYATPDGPITIHVAAQSVIARVAVSDGGPGLTLDQQKQLFERFYRVEGIPLQQGSAVGLGLGLAICRDIVERHGGAVGVESARGSGSTFWFTLPIAPA